MPPPIRRGLSPLRLVLAVGYLSLCAATYWIFQSHAARLSNVPPIEAHRARIPLEAHIMSKCPDAKDCLDDLVLPAMQKAQDKVNFTLSFIGTPTENDDGVACKHGPEECLGNIIELCAQKLYPDPKTYLGFAMCLTRDYEHIPQRGLIEDCALEHAIDFRSLNDCATRNDGADGMSMLRGSVQRTAEVRATHTHTPEDETLIYSTSPSIRPSVRPSVRLPAAN
ncbi:hypothetical protein BT67DRAFT_441852 [Trichocladium antarcticum]|uniref:Gamma interferon inducible lysosomal thiol reductase n=1 Tax=Trichocladium antarcticum TaxID=1450529 RepID=A0AAN6ZEE0_9PEZI|nr:hypothetical protein BT67DRAFT_441852 [Trichocladium antarcticum]